MTNHTKHTTQLTPIERKMRTIVKERLLKQYNKKDIINLFLQWSVDGVSVSIEIVWRVFQKIRCTRTFFLKIRSEFTETAAETTRVRTTTFLEWMNATDRSNTNYNAASVLADERDEKDAVAKIPTIKDHEFRIMLKTLLDTELLLTSTCDNFEQNPSQDQCELLDLLNEMKTLMTEQIAILKLKKISIRHRLFLLNKNNNTTNQLKVMLLAVQEDVVAMIRRNRSMLFLPKEEEFLFESPQKTRQCSLTLVSPTRTKKSAQANETNKQEIKEDIYIRMSGTTNLRRNRNRSSAIITPTATAATLEQLLNEATSVGRRLWVALLSKQNQRQQNTAAKVVQHLWGKREAKNNIYSTVLQTRHNRDNNGGGGLINVDRVSSQCIVEQTMVEIILCLEEVEWIKKKEQELVALNQEWKIFTKDTTSQEQEEYTINRKNRTHNDKIKKQRKEERAWRKGKFKNTKKQFRTKINGKKGLLNSLRKRHESLRQRVPAWEHATSETDIGYTVRVNEMKAFDNGMKLLHDINVCKFPSSRQFKDLIRSVKKKSKLIRYVNVIAIDPGKPDQEHCQENDDQRSETETTNEHQDDCEASKHLVVYPATTDPVTDLGNQQQSTHECRLKFRALGKDRITTLFTRKGRSASAVLPENVLWQLFSRLNVQKPLFQTIFNELCLVDHDTSDDDSGTVELVDFLDWCWSDETHVGAEVEESKRPTVAHSHLPSPKS